MFMHRHCQVRSFSTEIWLRKGLHMLSMGNPLIPHQSAILDWNFKMMLCASMGHNRHCSCTGMSCLGDSLLKSGCGKVPPVQDLILALRRPYWIGPKSYLTCIKVPSKVMTMPDMSEIHPLMSEIWPRKGKSLRQTDGRTDGRTDRRTDGRTTDAAP